MKNIYMLVMLILISACAVTEEMKEDNSPSSDSSLTTNWAPIEDTATKTTNWVPIEDTAIKTTNWTPINPAPNVDSDHGEIEIPGPPSGPTDNDTQDMNAMNNVIKNMIGHYYVNSKDKYDVYKLENNKLIWISSGSNSFAVKHKDKWSNVQYWALTYNHDLEIHKKYNGDMMLLDSYKILKKTNMTVYLSKHEVLRRQWENVVRSFNGIQVFGHTQYEMGIIDGIRYIVKIPTNYNTYYYFSSENFNDTEYTATYSSIYDSIKIKIVEKYGRFHISKI